MLEFVKRSHSAGRVCRLGVDVGSLKMVSSESVLESEFGPALVSESKFALEPEFNFST